MRGSNPTSESRINFAGGSSLLLEKNQFQKIPQQSAISNQQSAISNCGIVELWN
jgi:hypothetical protein